MREPMAEDVFGPIVSRYLREKSSPNQRQADETAGRLQAIERLAKELTTEPLLEQPPKLLDVIREQQSVEDQWQAFGS